ncbi:hypothetical protein ACFO8O_01160 [Hephaestia sp. GCM10023244]|uniref:hypothetical protein n=1 Tax=unclassified Hephaestia TaxID=2631281 RepID=UPI002077774C|nr:hypothetical protein [Hephaestia sp. MAHUQ-44]MCM8729578.1 hypothetical protein [Hephaestia sp. MAHUQ-44]
MNAITHITATPAASDRTRCDGWTPDRQRAFLEAIAEGHNVDAAARIVGMTRQSAYALRHRAAGAAFAVGWSAATMIAREHIADTLLTRAIDGQVDTYTRADGTEITRHRYDNRLATTLLARLDRMVETAPEPEAHAARLAAREFDAYLDLIERSPGPARAALFLSGRAHDDDAPDLAAIATLARADHWLRTGAGLAADIDTADLDPAQRAGWSADQWARAEAAGLVAIAPPPARQLCQLSPNTNEGEDRAAPDPDAAPESPVWWCPYADDWRTRFAPPAGFDGTEDGRFGDDDYSRTLTVEEALLVETAAAIENAELCAEHAPERTTWFAALAAQIGLDAPDAAGAPAPDSADRADAEGPDADPRQDQPESPDPVR